MLCLPLFLYLLSLVVIIMISAVFCNNHNVLECMCPNTAQCIQVLSGAEEGFGPETDHLDAIKKAETVNAAEASSLVSSSSIFRFFKTFSSIFRLILCMCPHTSYDYYVCVCVCVCVCVYTHTSRSAPTPSPNRRRLTR